MVTETPPVKSMSKILAPRDATATNPIAMSTNEADMAMARLPIKSSEEAPTILIMFSLAIQRFRSAMSNTIREQKMAVNILIRMPRMSVTANPRIWSVPMT